MNNLKNILLIGWGVLSALFYVLLKSKNKTIAQQKDQIKQHESKNEELQFINDQEKKAKDDKDTISTSSESDVDRLLEQNKAYRD